MEILDLKLFPLELYYIVKISQKIFRKKKMKQLNEDDMPCEDDKVDNINTFDNCFRFNDKSIEKNIFKKNAKLNILDIIKNILNKSISK